MLQEILLGVDTLLAKLTCKVMEKKIQEGGGGQGGGLRRRGWGQCGAWVTGRTEVCVCVCVRGCNLCVEN